MRRRRMMRQLRKLDRIDALYGLGATPESMARPADNRTLSGTVMVLSVLIVLGVVVVSGGLLPASWEQRLGLGKQPLGTAPAASDSTSYAFVHTQPDGDEPVAWDPCRPIRYVVNPAGGPQDAEALVQESIADVSRLTGLQFDYRGSTDDRPRWGKERRWLARPDSYEVLVSWASSDEVAQLAGRVAGIGGATAFGRSGGRMRYTSGGATLDADAFRSMESHPRGRALQRAIVLHELGHVIGLDHVDDPQQLMNAENVGVVQFSDGDRAGLARLGSGHCF